MKKFFLLIMLTAFGVSAFAQEGLIITDGYESVALIPKDKRGPYLTNRFFDNIFIGVGGGVNLYWGENDSYGSFGKRLAPALDFSIGKWITPSVGLRMQYSGLKAFGWTNYQSMYATGEPDSKGMYREKFNTMNIHGDVLWNLSNAIGGYREDRTWSFIPYVGFGGARSFKDGHHKNEFAATAGLLNNIRLGGLVDLTLEIKQLFVNQRFDGVVRGSGFESMTTVTAGLTFKLGRSGFSRPAPIVIPDYAPYKKRIHTLENELAQSQNNAKAMAAELAKAKAQTQQSNEVVKTVTVPTVMAVFFQIGSAELSEKDMINLGNIAETIKKEPNRKFTITGYADSYTGSYQRNMVLSQMRADAVKQALVNKFGVNASQLTTIGKGGVDNYANPSLDRMVKIE